MSYTFEAPDPGTKGDVDFDFFDDTESRHSPTNLGNSGKWSSARDHAETKAKDEKQVKMDGKNSKGTDSGLAQNKLNRDSSSSDTDSYSSDYTDDEDNNRDSEQSKEVKKIEAKIPTADSELGHSRNKNSENDNKNRKQSTSPSPRTDSARRKNRPKTGHHKNMQRRRSYSSGSDRSKSSLSDSEYTTDSDSDVTDVSPLNSPHTPVTAGMSRRSQSETSTGRSSGSRPPKHPLHKEVTFRRPDSATSSNRDPLIRADSDNIDLRLLMQAVSEMEHGKMRQTPSDYSHVPVFHAPVGHVSPPKKNMSFSNDSVRTIDRENQRLMQQIMKCSKQAKLSKKNIRSKKPVPVTGNKMSTSAINRHREQQRIERENFAMLQRLMTSKPTKQLARDKLMTDYENHQLFGCSVAAAHPLPKKKMPNKSPSPYMVPFDPQFQSENRTRKLSAGETRSEISSHSVATTDSAKKTRPVSATTRGSRPLSATSTGKQRPQSAKAPGFGTNVTTPNKQRARPAWDERW